MQGAAVCGVLDVDALGGREVELVGAFRRATATRVYSASRATVWKDSGQVVSSGRVLRAKIKLNKAVTQLLTDDQIRQISDHEPRIIVEALLAQFEPRLVHIQILSKVVFGT